MDELLSELNGIPIDPDNIVIIHTPSDFYNQLVSHTKQAKNRIAISSLYLGDGQLENQLVDAVKENLDRNPDLDVQFLLDFLRGTRGQADEKSSTTLLKRIADKAEVYLYHSPDLRGILKKILPERTNEIVGLQHMKLYIFDDNVLISGANLSDSYFTNRQDRYIFFKNCPELATFFSKIIKVVGEYSFKLNKDGSVELSPDCPVHPFKDSYSSYTKLLHSKIKEVMNSLENLQASSTSDTFIYPIIQMGPFNLNQELDFLKGIFSINDENMKITIASGYFNTTEEYEDLIFKEGKYQMDIITAAPEANGFFGAKGLSKHIPAMYSHITGSFLNKVKVFNRDITLYEYIRKDWTFHAKGLWIDTPKMTATLIGSSNYGYRSVHRDLEAQLLVVSTNQKLRQRLGEERSLITNFTSVIDVAALRRAEHYVPTIVKAISKVIRNFF